MPTINELKKQVEELKKKEDFENALPLYAEIWEREVSDWNGYYLAQCYRKTGSFSKARELHSIIKSKFPKFKAIQNEELWLDYSQKIKDWKNGNLLEDAEKILSKTNQYDKYTGSVYQKTILGAVKYLLHDRQYRAALEWLDRLDFTILSNTPFNIKGKKYPSDQKTFFIFYAEALIELNEHGERISTYLSCLGFTGVKHSQFKEKIMQSIASQTYKLGLYLKLFKEEIYDRKKKDYKLIYNPNKPILVSDIGDFEFCPSSFAINQTFVVRSNTNWEKDEWNVDKKYLIDRYNMYQQSKDINKSFADTGIDINDTTKNDFYPIFRAKLLINNYDGTNDKHYSNASDTIRGVPDYVFENEQGKKFVVIEKFTKKITENTNAFPNDLARIYGYMFELSTLNLDFGYLIYWYWNYVDVPTDNENSSKKKMKVMSYRIFKVEKTAENKDTLNKIIEKIKSFKQSKQLAVEGDRISFANKCLQCSVVSYCHHKTGKFNLVKLPYDIDDLKINPSCS